MSARCRLITLRSASLSVVPANGTQALPTNGTVVTITFSEPAEASSVHSGTVQLQLGNAGVGTTLTLSADGRVATLTPVNRLAREFNLQGLRQSG